MKIRYTLMHRDTPVTDLVLDDGYLVRLERTHAIEHAPLGTTNMLDRVGEKEMRFWLQRRAIPNVRTNLAKALEDFGMISPVSALESNLGLSLSDTYWLRPQAARDVTWADINLFDNDFAPHSRQKNGQIVLTADASSSGRQEKHWVIGKDGQRYLIKFADGRHASQPCNERIASSFARALDYPHIPYTTRRIDGRMASICPCAVTGDEDYVCAYDILQTQKVPMPRPDNDLAWLRSQYEQNGIDFESFAKQQSLVDVAIRNEDRHWSNFGIVRDAQTLRWKRAMPLFDFGNSLWFDSATDAQEPTSMFSGRVLMQDIDYVRSISTRQISAIRQLPDMARHILRESGMPHETQTSIVRDLEQRCSTIERKLIVKLEADQRCHNCQNGSTTYTRTSRPSTSERASPARSRDSGDAQPSSRQGSSPSSTSEARTAIPYREPSSAPTRSAESEVT